MKKLLLLLAIGVLNLISCTNDNEKQAKETAIQYKKEYNLVHPNDDGSIEDTDPEDDGEGW